MVCLCHPAGLVSYFISSTAEETQYEMLIHIAVTFNALVSDSYVLFVHWCFIVAVGILSAERKLPYLFETHERKTCSNLETQKQQSNTLFLYVNRTY